MAAVSYICLCYVRLPRSENLQKLPNYWVKILSDCFYGSGEITKPKKSYLFFNMFEKQEMDRLLK